MNPRALIPLVLFLIASATMGGCEEKVKPSILSDIDSKTIPQQESWNSTVVISDSGKVKAVIEAGYIRVYEVRRQTLLSEGVVAHFFDEKGVATSELHSREAMVDDRTNDFEATGNVVVTSSDSTVLRTEHLYFTNADQLIHTPDDVWITSPKESIQGRGFEAQQNLRNYRIFQVSGEARSR
jgi:LPS export ABC transporter protein LptC